MKPMEAKAETQMPITGSIPLFEQNTCRLAVAAVVKAYSAIKLRGVSVFIRMQDGAAAIALAWLLIACSCSIEVTRDANAVVLEAEGYAHVEKSGTSAVLERNTRVRTSDVLTTKSVAHLTISLLPGALIETAGETGLRIDKLRLTKN